MGKVTEKFEQFKSWYQSKTIIGLIISSISGVVFALTNGSVDVAGAVNETISGAEGIATSADDVIAAVMFVVGQVVALYGRITAKVGISTGSK